MPIVTLIDQNDVVSLFMIRTSTKVVRIQEATMAVGNNLKRKRLGADSEVEDAENTSSSPVTMTTARAPKSRRVSSSSTTSTTSSTSSSSSGSEDMAVQLRRIAASDRTPFEKRVWSALCQIPAGRVSTYGLMSAYLGSSPRAVGGALRRNPFAPEVPCHRVVATGGGMGGFKGHPSNRKTGEGITMPEKKALLRGEGVKIDTQGRVLGTPWGGFV